FDPQSGLTFLVGENLDADTANGVILHEVTHGAQRESVNQAAARLLNTADRQGQKLKNLLAQVKARMRSAGAMDKDGNILDIDEAPAYIVELAASQGRQEGYSAVDGRFMDWVDKTFGKRLGNIIRDYVAVVRAGLRRLGAPVQLSVDDILAMARHDMKQAAEGRVRDKGGVVTKSTVEAEPEHDSALQESAKAFFGTTRDPMEAGYVLPDGTLLDFSGRHYSSRDNWPYLKGQRSVDHRELAGESLLSGGSLDLASGSGSDMMAEFMRRTGAMRVDMASGVASVMGMPTDQQILFLGRNRKGDYLGITSIDADTQRIRDEAEFDSATGAKARKFFEDAQEKPATGPKFSFAGPNAKTANAQTLDTAQQMLADGADGPTIWKATGWYQDEDGMWRFEIDDNAAVFNNPYPEQVELANELREAGADLAKHRAATLCFPRLINLAEGKVL
ncbi:MAG: hypothetical protein H7842_08915, partial [Gammaproteobacteria bacterium SHHR-1]